MNKRREQYAAMSPDKKSSIMNMAIGGWIVFTMLWILLFYTSYVAGWSDGTRSAFSWLSIIFSSVLLVGNAKAWFFTKYEAVS
jgi:hypothetical protein